MIDTFKTYFQRHFAFDSLFDSKESGKAADVPEKYGLNKSKQFFLYFLRVSPFLCGMGFGLSFLEAFQTNHLITWDIFGYPLILNFAGILKIICVSGLIGFGTNYIAIKMLFRPVVKRPILGQGLIPAQKDRIIYTLAQGIYRHVLNQDLIRKRVEETGLVKKVNSLVMDGAVGLLQDEELREHIKSIIVESMNEYAEREDVRKEIAEMIDTRLEQNLDKGLKKFLLQTYKRYNKEDYEEVIEKIVKDLPQLALEVIEKLEDQLDRAAAYIRKEKEETAEKIMDLFIDLLNKLDITDLLAKQMAHFNEAELERLVWESTNEQLRYIQYLGTILGMLGGLLIWAPELMITVYALLIGIIAGLDSLLFRIATK
ncbi:MAG: DUF445 family protein [Bacteroidota bacterium]